MKKQLPRLVMNTLLVLITSLGAVFSVSSAFDLSINYIVVTLTAACASLLFSACFSFRRARWALLPLGAAVLVLALFTGLFSTVGATFTQLLHDILTRFSSAYPNFSFAIPAAKSGPQSLTLLFSLFAVLMSVWMAWGVGYRSCLISVAGTLPFLLLCVVINDTPPHVIPLIMLLSGWITVLLCKERPDEPASMDASRIGLTLMAVLLLLAIVGTVYPKDEARQLPDMIQSLLDQLPGPMQNMLSRNSTGSESEDLGADTDETLDLTTQGTRNRKDTVMLQVSCTETGTLYLRGAAKDVYTGTSWESKNGADVSQSVYAQTSLGTSFGSSSQAAVQIHNEKDKATVVFTPYGYISSTGAEDITSDLRVESKSDDYIIYYWPGTQSLDLDSAVGNSNTGYDQYVEDTCLELPADTKETLYNLALSYGYDPDMSTAETIAWVTEFVRSIGTYRLDVSRQPTNYDFAVYFLTESRQGYCVHFATAAAAMFRALGIPSRYASGYRVTITEAGTVTDVTDKDTHAWAEVYLKGLGWIPIETTPGFGSSAALPSLEQEQQPAASPSPSPEPAEPSPSEEAAASPSPSEAPVSPSETETGAVPSAEPVTPANPSGGGFSPWVFSPIAVLILAFLAMLIRRGVIVSRRKKRFDTAGRNQAVIYRYMYLERLIPWGAEIPEDLTALALKAKFSRHEITPEEFDPYRLGVAALSAQVEGNLRGWKKFRFRWISCLGLPKK